MFRKIKLCGLNKLTKYSCTHLNNVFDINLIRKGPFNLCHILKLTLAAKTLENPRLKSDETVHLYTIMVGVFSSSSYTTCSGLQRHQLTRLITDGRFKMDLILMMLNPCTIKTQSEGMFAEETVHQKALKLFWCLVAAQSLFDYDTSCCFFL